MLYVVRGHTGTLKYTYPYCREGQRGTCVVVVQPFFKKPPKVMVGSVLVGELNMFCGTLHTSETRPKGISRGSQK